MPLTDAEIRGFRSEQQRFRRSDSGGLFLDIMPSEKKVFRLAYRSGGKQRTLLIGEYPAIRLADARLRVAEVKRELHQGVDPKTASTPTLDEKDDENENATASDERPLWREIAHDYLMLRLSFPRKTGPLHWPREGDCAWRGSDPQRKPF